MKTKAQSSGLDNTRLFMSLTAGAGTRCMSLLSSPPSLSRQINVFAGLEKIMNEKMSKRILLKICPRENER